MGSTFTPVDGVQSRRFMKSIVVSLLQSTYRVRDVICEHSRKNSLVTAEIAVQICQKRAVLLASLQSEVQHFFLRQILMTVFNLDSEPFIWIIRLPRIRVLIDKKKLQKSVRTLL